MSIRMDVNVTIKGGLIRQDIERIAQKQIVYEIFDKVTERVERGGRGLGARRNRITERSNGFYEIVLSSTRIFPRTIGSSWVKKNVAIIRAMAPRVASKAAQRIAEEMG